MRMMGRFLILTYMKYIILFYLINLISDVSAQDFEIKFINLGENYIEYCNYNFERQVCLYKEKSYFDNDSLVFIDCLEISLKQNNLVVSDSITKEKIKGLKSAIHKELEPKERGNSVLICYLLVNQFGVIESVFIEGPLNGFRVDSRIEDSASRFLTNNRIHEGWSEDSDKLLLISVRY